MLTGIYNVSTQYHEIPPDAVVTFRKDGVLQLGGLTWQVLHTPGHTYRQTCFYQPETKQLLSADHILAKTPTPVVESHPEKMERMPSLPQFLQSLDLIQALEIEKVYPGHGRPFSNVNEVIKRQRIRIDERKAECLALIKNGRETIPDLLDVMYSHYPKQYRSVGLWMIVGYLDLLKVDELVQERTIDGIWHYFAV